MNRQEKHQANLGKLDQGDFGPAEKPVQFGGVLQGQTQNIEVGRQKQRQANTGQPVNNICEP